MAMVLAGRAAEEAAIPLQSALSGAATQIENWDTRAALLWSLVTAERFQTVETALELMVAEAQSSGSARGFVADARFTEAAPWSAGGSGCGRTGRSASAARE